MHADPNGTRSYRAEHPDLTRAPGRSAMSPCTPGGQSHDRPPSELRDRLPRRPALPSLAHLLLRLFVPRRQLRGDVEALFDDGAIVEFPERIGGADRAVDGAVTSGPDQGGQVRLPRVHSRAAGGPRSAPDHREGVAD